MISRRSSDLPATGIFLLSAFVTLGPALLPGYVLSLDMVFAPRFNFGFIEGLYSINVPLLSLLWLLSRVFPIWLLQKAILITVLFLPAMAMWTVLSDCRLPSRYLGAFVYTYNPFVFSRLIAGHWQFLLAYAVAPFVVRAIFETFSDPSWKSGAVMGGAIAAIALLSLHFVFVWLIVLAAYVYSLTTSPKNTLSVSKALMSATVVFLVVSSFWLVAYASSAQTPAPFAQRDFSVFASRSHPVLGTAINVAALNGFWQKEVPQISDIMPFWPWLYLGILSLAVYGLLQHTLDGRERRRRLAVMAAVTIMAVIAAMGVSSPITRSTYLFFYERVPFFKGYREPNKFLALAAIAYAFGSAYGLEALTRRLRRRYAAIIVSVAFFVIVVVYAYPFAWGLGGELRSVKYPHSWYAADRYLSEHPGSKVISLPWEQYLAFDFAGKSRVLSNPARIFFRATMITPDETGAVADSQLTGETDVLVSKAFRPPYDKTAFLYLLDKLGADYVLLLREDQFRQYQPLVRSGRLRLKIRSRELELYEVKRFPQ